MEYRAPTSGANNGSSDYIGFSYLDPPIILVSHKTDKQTNTQSKQNTGTPAVGRRVLKKNLLPIFFYCFNHIFWVGPKGHINWVQEPTARVPSPPQELEGGSRSDPNF